MFFIDCTPLPLEDMYQLNKSIIIEGVLIPESFKWNGASIPPMLWAILGSPFSPKLMVPSLVHDYLYIHGKALGFSRKQVDKLFRKLLLANGVPEEDAETIYLGVRVGGKLHFNYA